VKKANVRMLTFAAMLSAVSAALMYLETPLPFLPPFLKLDLSNAPLLIGAFLMGPLPAVLMTAVKDAVHLLGSSSGGVGELADFLVTSSLLVPAAVIYRFKRTRRGAVIGCAAGIGGMLAAGVLANAYILLPFYSNVMHFPLEEIFAASSAVNPAITGLGTYLLFGVAPFNLIKGLLICGITMVVYKKISVFIRRFTDSACAE